MRSLVLVAALSVVGAAPATSQEWANFGPPGPPPQVAFQMYKVSMLKLRDEARSLQKADGGVLTPEHDAEIQRKIDRTTITFHRRVGGLPF